MLPGVGNRSSFPGMAHTLCRNRAEGVNLSLKECRTPHLSSSESPAGLPGQFCFQERWSNTSGGDPLGWIHGGARRYLPGSSVQASRRKGAKENLLADMCASSVPGDREAAAHRRGDASSLWDGMEWEQPHCGGRVELCHRL